MGPAGSVGGRQQEALHQLCIVGVEVVEVFLGRVGSSGCGEGRALGLGGRPRLAAMGPGCAERPRSPMQGLARPCRARRWRKAAEAGPENTVKRTLKRSKRSRRVQMMQWHDE